MKFYPNELTAIKNADIYIFLESMEVTQALSTYVSSCGVRQHMVENSNFYLVFVQLHAR